MKHLLIGTALVSAILFAPAVFAENTPPVPPDTAVNMDKCPAKCMSEMQENKKKMQLQMEKMHTTTDPLERQELMREHMQTMQKNMKLMNSMGGGMMGGDVNQRLDMIEMRLDMMQMMMDQMMQQHQMMKPMPAK